MKFLYRTLGIGALLMSFSAANADTYISANFSGQIAGGNANVKAPFTAVLTQVVGARSTTDHVSVVQISGP